MLDFRKYILLVVLYSACFGQELKEEVNSSFVKTIELFNLSTGLKDPYINLNNDYLGVSFDVLSEEVNNLSYRIRHCNWDWQESDLSYSEFSGGFKEHSINDYRMSFNTFLDYVNYSFVLPNDDLPILISGNYVLEVFDEADEEEIIWRKRFVVYQNSLSVKAKVVRPQMVEDIPYKQKLEVEVNLENQAVEQPFRNIKIALIQNNNWNTLKNIPQAQYIAGNNMIFSNEDLMKFDAVNEFRFLDSRAINTNNERSISNFMEKDTINYILTLDPSRSHLNYITNEDFNGGFIVANESERDPEINSEYLKVHFTLGINRPISDGSFHSIGAYNQFQCNEDNQFYFDTENKVYRSQQWIKQGYYNYWIVFKNNKGEVSYTTLEGSHSEANNQYQVLVYYRDFSLGTELVLSSTTIDTKDFR